MRLYICCIDFRGMRQAHEENLELVNTNEGYIHAYPNPNDGKELMVDYSIYSSGDAVISVLNTFGTEVYKTNVQTNTDEAIHHASLSLSYLPAGMYIIHINNGVENLFTKLLVVK